MHTTCPSSGGVSTRALFHLVALWLLVSTFALAAHTASGLAITYTITGSDGTHRIDATLTVNDQAPYNDSAEGYRTYYNGVDQRAIMSGSYTIKSLSSGEVIDHGTVGTGTSYVYVFPDHRDADYDWLMFYFDTENGTPTIIAVQWADKTAFATLTPPTCFGSQLVHVSSSNSEAGSLIYTQALSIASDANVAALRARIAELEGQTATLQSQLSTAGNTIAALNAENAALQTENTNLQTQLNTAQQAIDARDVTIAGLRNELGAAHTQIVALQSDASDIQASLQRMVLAFRSRFNNPTFTLRGADTNARLDSLIDGILDLNRGSQQQLYFQLTDKK